MRGQKCTGKTRAARGVDNWQVKEACRQVVRIEAGLVRTNLAIEVWVSVLAGLSIQVECRDVDVVAGSSIQFEDSVAVDYGGALSFCSAAFNGVAFLRM